MTSVSYEAESGSAHFHIALLNEFGSACALVKKYNLENDTSGLERLYHKTQTTYPLSPVVDPLPRASCKALINSASARQVRKETMEA